jgi:pantoate--beta-alanine ligase
MQVISELNELTSALRKSRAKNDRIGFVPTMGALHSGHASLIHHAKSQSQFVVLSIFVNPTQFNDSADFENYPSTVQADLEMARLHRVDLVFMPKADDVYGGTPSADRADYGILTASFEGRKRPGHFDGVISVVRRLFNIVGPDVAFFGEKDLQQLQVIRHLARQEFSGISIVGCPLIREQDGLAMSSRNVRIPLTSREHALKISSCLTSIHEAVTAGNSMESAVRDHRHDLESDSQVDLEYLEAVDAQTFERMSELETGKDCFVIVAAVISGVRLIDNCRV